tara:strand:+ start:312 stop:647 length:336 start_codon:yes stop_codon:yes gene_type:complete
MVFSAIYKGLIWGYQKGLFALRWLFSAVPGGPCCRFHPTCSTYSAQAVEKYGIVKGLWLTAKRIGRCHPWNDQDWEDPVPHKFEWLATNRDSDLDKKEEKENEKLSKPAKS